MLKLSKQSDYALILLSVLAQLEPGTYIGLNHISRTHHLPYKFIGQIATKLRHAGLITSKEGSGGGYALAKPPHQINVGQVITILDGPIAAAACVRGETCRCADSCRHQYVMADISQTVITSLKTHTLADIIDPAKKQ